MKLNNEIKDKSSYNLDYKKIEDKIDFDKYTKKPFLQRLKDFFTTKKLAFVASFIVVTLLVGIIINNVNSNNSNDLNNNISGNNNFNTSEINNKNRVISNEKSLLGIAAHKEFDNNKSKKASMRFNLTNSDSNNSNVDNDQLEEEEYPKVSYPFDYVKIVQAYKFEIEINDIQDNIAKEFIVNSCGLGRIEVVVADFETYIENEDSNKILSVCDTLISLRGHNGYYTILLNSYMRNNDDYFLCAFSSHKKILETEVNKDFTPPILTIFLDSKGNDRYISFKASDDILDIYYYKQKDAFKNITNIEKVSNNTMYSVLDIQALPTKTVEVVIEEIDIEDKQIIVKSDDNLEIVYINEYTEGSDLASLKIEDIIIVEYDDLFEGYNPYCICANSIIVKETKTE